MYTSVSDIIFDVVMLALYPGYVTAYTFIICTLLSLYNAPRYNMILDKTQPGIGFQMVICLVSI